MNLKSPILTYVNRTPLAIGETWVGAFTIKTKSGRVKRLGFPICTNGARSVWLGQPTMPSVLLDGEAGDKIRFTLSDKPSTGSAPILIWKDFDRGIRWAAGHEIGLGNGRPFYWQVDKFLTKMKGVRLTKTPVTFHLTIEVIKPK